MEKVIMKILIIDGAGKTGHVVSMYLIDQGYDVDIYGPNQFMEITCIIGEFTNFKLISEVLQQKNYSVVINFARVINQDAEDDKTKAILINSYLPHYLSTQLSKTDTKLIQISTDCVFSGENGPYDENSVKDGNSFYALTKGVGEVINKKDLTIRTSVIGPDYNIGGSGLFNWFMKQSDTINGYNLAIWTGVTSILLAKSIDKLIKMNTAGLIHLVNNKSINKLDLLELFNKQFKNSQINTNPNSSVNHNKTLLNTKLVINLDDISYEDMIIEMKEWIVNKEHLYQHYFIKREVNYE